MLELFHEWTYKCSKKLRFLRINSYHHFIASLVLIFLTIITIMPHQGVKLLNQLSGSAFVTRTDTSLMVNNSQLRLVGYNWHWIGTGCEAPTNSEIATTFAQIKNISHGNVVRTAFYQSGSNNGSYTDFNRYIAYAKKYGLYLVPVLVNHWTSCEPSNAAKTASWYQAGYKQTNDGYPLSFREYAIQLAQHYANEPTIAFWQLVNEPDTDICSFDGATILRHFADDLTTAIKAVDPHHLVDLGAPGGCAGDNATDYAEIVSGKVDLCDVWHDYAQETVAMPTTLEQRINVCQHLKKPSFVGESGICADITASGNCSGSVTAATLSQRARFFDAKLKAGFQAGLAGYIIWNKGSQSVEDDVGPNDPTQSVLAKYATS